jgi:hypothetical protein
MRDRTHWECSPARGFTRGQNASRGSLSADQCEQLHRLAPDQGGEVQA